MRAHRALAAGMVFLFLAAPGFGQDKRRAIPFSYQSPVQTITLCDCGDFQVWEDWVDFAHGVALYDKSGLQVRQLTNTDFGGTNVYYNASNPDLFLVGRPGEGQNFRWEWKDGMLYMSGVFNKIMIPGYGHILMETGHWTVNLATGEGTNTGRDLILSDGDLDALCSYLRPKP